MPQMANAEPTKPHVSIYIREESNRLIRRIKDGSRNCTCRNIHSTHSENSLPNTFYSSNMHTQLFSLIVSLFAVRTLQSLVTFTNPTSITSHTQQQCSDGGYTDFCCVPLDLDLDDERGYGWFYAEEALLQNLGSVDIFAAIYRNNPTISPCYGEAVVTKTSHTQWKSPLFKQSPFISGVLVKKSFRPLFARKRMPNSVTVEGRQYVWDGVMREPMLFKDSAGKIVRGKPFGLEGQSNYTYAAML